MKDSSLCFLKNINKIEDFIINHINNDLATKKIDVEHYQTPFVSGDYILNLIFSFLGKKKINPINDDFNVYYFFEKTQLINFDMEYEIMFYRKKQTNFFKIKSAALSCPSQMINKFDLNCYRIAFDIKRKKLYFDDHFLFFLNNLEIIILDHEPMNFANVKDKALKAKQKFELYFNEEKAIYDYLGMLQAFDIYPKSVFYISSESVVKECLDPHSLKIVLRTENISPKILKVRTDQILVSEEQKKVYKILDNKSLVYSYVFYLKEHQKINLLKFYENVKYQVTDPLKYQLKDAYLVEVLQTNKRFFSQDVAKSKWDVIEAFFSCSLNSLSKSQDLLIKSLRSLTLKQFANLSHGLLKYQEYISIFEEKEIIDFIYSDEKNNPEQILNDKVKKYEESLAAKLFIDLNYKSYPAKIKMITSISEIRKIGIDFQNCIIDQEFNMINSLNSRILLIENDDGISLVRYLQQAKQWYKKDHESPKKRLAPNSHITIADRIQTELNQIEVHQILI